MSKVSIQALHAKLRQSQLGTGQSEKKTTVLRPVAQPSKWFARLRKQLRGLTFRRFLLGGRATDLSRLWRYAFLLAAGLSLTWGPAISYMMFAPKSYTSRFSLILPGAGSSASVSLSEIGQASSASNSAYASSTLSPTVTYKNLMLSANVINAAETRLAMEQGTLAAPTVKLVDETALISVSMSGSTPQKARDRAQAVLDAFLIELNALRGDELKRRESATSGTVKQYEDSMNEIQMKISQLQLESGLSSLDQFNGFINSADLLESQISELEAELAKTQTSKLTLASNLNLDTNTASITLKLHADSEFAILADEASKAQAVFGEAAKQFGAKHPKVVEARARFEGSKGLMMARAVKITGVPARKLVGKIDLAPTGARPALLAQLVSLSTDASGLESKVKSMKDELASRRAKISSLVGVAARLDALNRNHKIAEAVFASAFARINTSKTDIFASYPMVQLAEAPIRPLEPSSPNKVVAVGSAVGATVLLLIAILLGWLRKPMIEMLLSKKTRRDEEPQPA